MQVSLSRVATVREKSLENEIFFQVREKSGNFNFSQGKLEKMIKVREFEKFPKKVSWKISYENHNFY